MPCALSMASRMGSSGVCRIRSALCLQRGPARKLTDPLKGYRPKPHLPKPWKEVEVSRKSRWQALAVPHFRPFRSRTITLYLVLGRVILQARHTFSARPPCHQTVHSTLHRIHVHVPLPGVAWVRRGGLRFGDFGTCPLLCAGWIKKRVGPMAKSDRNLRVPSSDDRQISFACFAEGPPQLPSGCSGLAKSQCSLEPDHKKPWVVLLGSEGTSPPGGVGTWF